MKYRKLILVVINLTLTMTPIMLATLATQHANADQYPDPMKDDGYDWQPATVEKNALAMSRGQETGCIAVAHIKGALPMCLALVHHDPSRCAVIENAEVRKTCEAWSKP